jgi:hypothetical protein
LILKSDHREIFIDLLDILLVFGAAPERLEQPQVRNFKLDDPRISENYRKILHKQFKCHNIYRCVKNISDRGKASEWSLEDDHVYEILDQDITVVMLRVAPSLSKAMHVIRYWTIRITRNGIQHAEYSILEFYLENSDVDATYFDKTLTVQALQMHVSRKFLMTQSPTVIHMK